MADKKPTNREKINEITASIDRDFREICEKRVINLAAPGPEQQARSGQPISLTDLAAATHREEREKKRSVVEKLKNQPKQERKRTAPKRDAERER